MVVNVQHFLSNVQKRLETTYLLELIGSDLQPGRIPTRLGGMPDKRVWFGLEGTGGLVLRRGKHLWKCQGLCHPESEFLPFVDGDFFVGYEAICAIEVFNVPSPGKDLARKG